MRVRDNDPFQLYSGIPAGESFHAFRKSFLRERRMRATMAQPNAMNPRKFSPRNLHARRFAKVFSLDNFPHPQAFDLRGKKACARG